MLRAQTYRKMQIGLGVLLLAAMLLTLTAAFWPLTSVQAAGSGQGQTSTAVSPYTGCWFDWLDTGYCCNSWWFGKQDWEEQWVICPDGSKWPTGQYRCNTFSHCSG